MAAILSIEINLTDGQEAAVVQNMADANAGQENPVSMEEHLVTVVERFVDGCVDSTISQLSKTDREQIVADMAASE